MSDKPEKGKKNTIIDINKMAKMYNINKTSLDMKTSTVISQYNMY